MSGGRELDELAVAFEEHAAIRGRQFLPQEEVGDIQFLLGIPDGFPHRLERNLVVGAEAAEDMRLDQVPEREHRGSLQDRLHEGLDGASSDQARGVAAERPQSQGCGGYLDVPGRFGEVIGGLTTGVVLRVRGSLVVLCRGAFTGISPKVRPIGETERVTIIV